MRRALDHPRTWQAASIGAWLAACLFALSAAGFAPRARAQATASLTFETEARHRGEPASDGRPVATVSVACDLPEGFYLGGSAAVVATRSSGVQPQAAIEFAGLTRPVARGVALDVGVVHSGYSGYARAGGGASYTEGYVGLVGRNISAHAFYSPGYFSRDAATLYTEVTGTVAPAPDWSVSAHAGLLTPLGEGRYDRRDVTMDWRLGLRRRVGPADLSAAWTGYLADGAMPGGKRRHDSALVIGLSFGF